MLKPHKQRGIALITVLMILAIMVTVASTMTGRMTSSLLRTEGVNYSEKIYWYGQATVEFSRMILEDDFEDSEIVSLDQTWATPDLVFPVDEGQITGNMVDFRSCFNINALATQEDDDEDDEPLAVSQLKRLLEELDVEEGTADTIVESARDWVDSDDTADESEGAEDRYYESLQVPHLTANNLMVDISELRSVQGVTAEIYDNIKDYLCALPTSEQLINVNTVRMDKAALLYSLFSEDLDFTVEDFEELIDDRPTSGWESVEEFLSEDLLDGQSISDEEEAQLSVTSDYFQFYGAAEFDQRVIVLKLLFNVESEEATEVRFQYAGVDELVGTGEAQ
ncbi:type II secretion system minor pseudopilin GspK [Psychromonas sp. 14N.309.X.WAT.B.A12]|uniref:type II secretion system minor pseudopilin GspK n=1 Tax=unclassified Psychromonas TaxID=2614957 RepID=UPI0025AF1374|nr:type II secretion system minor pseudopilin GspK [Psychromonas sp. 14N.309.X.WAT.B.A12]MDN2664453.1 type II secretion system minor pseudopilin GspK [Psychromonas sp. 14N.309.X.WAT.B.A12]